MTIPTKERRSSVRAMRHMPCPETAASDPHSACATDAIRLHESTTRHRYSATVPQSKHGNVYLLVMVDFFSKWTEAAPLPNIEARTVADEIINHCVSRFGVPDSVHSHLESNFESRLVYEVCGWSRCHASTDVTLAFLS